MRRANRICGVVLVAVLCCVATSAASAKVRRGPAGLAFYTPPKILPGQGHGGLIWARRLSGSAALTGATNELVLYRSIGVDGKPTAVSGTVSVPRGRPPKG